MINDRSKVYAEYILGILRCKNPERLMSPSGQKRTLKRGTGDADLIALARTILYNPRWPWHAAAHFGAQVKVPDQYLRSRPRQYPDLFDTGH
jgi:hypothetical protein